MSEPSHSPLSPARPTKVRDLPRSFLLEELSNYFGAPCPDSAVQTNYSLWRCRDTGLEFSWPLEPGNFDFYKWISGFANYYPHERWEYFKTIARIRDWSIPISSLLDVGCGSGLFLKIAKGVRPKSLQGLDFNLSAIEECHKAGLSAFCGSVREGIGQGKFELGSFEIVTSFHCLEHVPEPLDFLRDLSLLLRPSGHIFISTPLSPMSFEGDWFDVMNHPPHHMTRWNVSSFRRAAEILGLQVKFHFPRANLFRQALQTINLKLFGCNSKRGNFAKALRLSFSGKELFQMWLKMRQRSRNNEGAGADVVLVEFTKQSEPA